MPGPAVPPRSGLLSRIGALAGASTTLLLVLATPALAGDSTAAGPPPAARTLCTLTDERMPELSGLVAVGSTMLAINDGGDRVSVAVLDGHCAIADVQTAPVDPYDPEDLAVGRDGTVWLADTGDNNRARKTVALIALHPDRTTSVFRLAYPDGAHDVEALLLAPDGTPYLVTKEVLGASGVYRPTAPLAEGATVPMGKVSTVAFTLTGTPGGPVGRAGQLMVTGGAVAADGHALALRTYTDAYVWPLSGSDVTGALAGKPVRIALPEAQQGEAISFTPDGRSLVVAGEGLPSDVSVVPLAAAPAPAAASTPAAAKASANPLDSPRSPITTGLIAAAVATLVVWIGGKFRRRGV